MSELTPAQQRLRQRFEGLIGAAAPLLDLLLGVGDRISRAVEPEDHEYYPVRTEGMPPPGEGGAAQQRGGGAAERRQSGAAGD